MTFTQGRGSEGYSIAQRHWGDASFHWVTTNTFLRPYTNFLDIAVECGLAKYVNNKLTENPLDIGRIWSLLTVALTKFDLEHVREDGSTFRRSKPVVEVVQVLLNHSGLLEITKSKWLEKAKDIRDSRSTPDYHSIRVELEKDNPLRNQQAVNVSQSRQTLPRIAINSIFEDGSTAISSETTSLPIPQTSKQRQTRHRGGLFFWKKT